jgi:hypothetical protein
MEDKEKELSHGRHIKKSNCKMKNGSKSNKSNL